MLTIERMTSNRTNFFELQSEKKKGEKKKKHSNPLNPPTPKKEKRKREKERGSRANTGHVVKRCPPSHESKIRLTISRNNYHKDHVISKLNSKVNVLQICNYSEKSN